MKPLDIALIGALLLAAILGFSFADDPYRLRSEGHPLDQMALDHRDSPYAHITWVVSESHNYAELRFFDAVEGGVCLYPRWDEMAGFAEDGSLDHIAMPADWDISGAPPGRGWPAERDKPNPGTVAKSAYVSMFPAGLLLNERLMAEANNDPRQATPNILVVGLGSGVGISVLAHHFPEASIAVVDIDAAVIDMVVDHYPFIAWLREQTTSDGRPRLKMGREEAVDARQYIRHPSLRRDDGRLYDMVIIDAFTDGSTIPPHLMTKEFFQEVRQCMPPDGIVLSNIIGSYHGPKSRVVGGSIRSQMAAGLEHVVNLPVMHDAREFDGETPRNNIILASANRLDPSGNSRGWTRLGDWVPYPELPTRRFVSHLVGIGSDGRLVSGLAQLPSEGDGAALRNELRSRAAGQTARNAPLLILNEKDADLLARARALVLEDYPTALGWTQRHGSDAFLHYREIDWVQYARNHWRTSVNEGRRSLPGRVLVHGSDTLIGPDGRGGTIPYAPLFSDARPNADIFNR